MSIDPEDPIFDGLMAEPPKSKQEKEAELRNAEAYNILYSNGLYDIVDKLYPRAQDFVEEINNRFRTYGDRTLISEGQLDWLRRLAEQYML